MISNFDQIAIEELLVNAIAITEKCAYPSAWIRRKALVSCVSRRSHDLEWSLRLTQTLAKFLPLLDNGPPSFQSFGDLYEAYRPTTDWARHVVRVFAAVSEIYSFCMSYYGTREWICPWHPWKWYVCSPLLDGETWFEQAIRTIFHFEHFELDADEDFPTTNKLLEISEVSFYSLRQLELPSQSNAMSLFGSVATVLRGTQLSWQDKLTIGIDHYLRTGEMRIKRRFGSGSVRQVAHILSAVLRWNLAA